MPTDLLTDDDLFQMGQRATAGLIFAGEDEQDADLRAMGAQAAETVGPYAFLGDVQPRIVEPDAAARAQQERINKYVEMARSHIGEEASYRQGRPAAETAKDFARTFRTIPVEDRDLYLSLLEQVAATESPEPEFDPLRTAQRSLMDMTGMPQNVARGLGMLSPEEEATLDFYNKAEQIRRAGVDLSKRELGDGALATAGELVQEGMTGAAGMAPAMVAGGVLGRAVAGGAGMAGAAPAVAQSAGAASSVGFWSAAEFPDLYDSAREMGIDKDQARAGAMIAAPLVGLVERIQVGQAAAPLKNLVKERIKQRGLAYAKEAAKSLGKTYLQEVGEEGVQAAIGTGMRGILASLDEDVELNDSEEGRRLVQTVRQAALSMPFLIGPSAGMQVVDDAMIGAARREALAGAQDARAADLHGSEAKTVARLPEEPRRALLEARSEARDLSQVVEGRRELEARGDAIEAEVRANMGARDEEVRQLAALWASGQEDAGAVDDVARLAELEQVSRRPFEKAAKGIIKDARGNKLTPEDRVSFTQGVRAWLEERSEDAGNQGQLVARTGDADAGGLRADQVSPPGRTGSSERRDDDVGAVDTSSGSDAAEDSQPAIASGVPATAEPPQQDSPAPTQVETPAFTLTEKPLEELTPREVETVWRREVEKAARSPFAPGKSEMIAQITSARLSQYETAPELDSNARSVSATDVSTEVEIVDSGRSVEPESVSKRDGPGEQQGEQGQIEPTSSVGPAAEGSALPPPTSGPAVDVVAESPGARKQRSIEMIDSGAFKEGDRVAFRSKSGEELTGTVRDTPDNSSMPGRVAVNVDQIAAPGGVPIGRIEFLPAVDLTVEKSGAFIKRTKPVSPRGQTALPGLEQEAEAIEQREEFDRRYQDVRDQIAEHSTPEFAETFREPLRNIRPAITTRLEAGNELDVEEIREELAGDLYEKVPRKTFESYSNWAKRRTEIEEVVDDAISNEFETVANDIGKVGKIERGKWYDDTYQGERGLTEQFKVTGEGVPFAMLRKPDGEVIESTLDDLEPYTEESSDAQDTETSAGGVLPAGVEPAATEPGAEVSTSGDLQGRTPEVSQGPDAPDVEPVETGEAAEREQALRSALAQEMGVTFEDEPAPQVEATGYADLPDKTRSSFNSAMIEKDAPLLQEWLHPSNKTVRKEFAARTGIKLPRTVKGTNEVVGKWVAGEEIPQAPKPKRKTLIEQADERKARTSKKLADELDSFKELLKRKKITSGVDPELVAGTVKLTKAAIDDGISTFAQYVAFVADAIGDSAARTMSPYLQDSWRLLGTSREYTGKIDEAGSAEEVLNERGREQDSGGPERAADGDAGPRAADLAEESPEAAEVDEPRGAESGDRGRSGELADDGGRPDRERQDVSRSPELSDEGVRDPSRPGGNYRIGSGDQIGGSKSFGAKTRFRENIAAIKLLKTLEEEGRKATQEEQSTLVKYIGWGGLKQAFGKGKLVDGKTVYSPIKGWESQFKELRELLTEEEWKQAKASIKNAHYTDPAVIDAIWKGLTEAGFQGGRIFEPSAGTGLFFGMMPESVTANQATRLLATEIEPLSGKIAQQLYQDADIQVAGFETAAIPDNSVDLFISNVPFGKYSLHDKHDKSVKAASIHNFFFNKAIQKTRPGGLVAFITSRYSMDEKDQSNRKFWRESGADLVGAIRLPHTAFKGIADTSVVTDIIILQKRDEGQKPSDTKWLARKNVPQEGYLELKREPGKRTVVRNEGRTTFPVNEYFGAHPEHVAGELAWTGTMQRATENQLNVEPGEGNLPETVQQLIAGLPFDRERLDRVNEMSEAMDNAARDAIKEGTWKDDHVRVENNRIYINDFGTKREVPAPYGRHKKDAEGNITEIEASKTNAARMKALVDVFDAAEELIALQPTNAADEEIEAAREKLNKVYDRVTKKFGPLSAGRNKTFSTVSLTMAARLASLEEYDPTNKTAEKVAVFRERTERPRSFPTSASTPTDALSISLSQRGRLDPTHIAELLGQDVNSGMDALVEQSLVFVDHASGEWQLASEYLSGNVREKLAAAKERAAKSPKFARNVEALEAVQPEPVAPSQIGVRLGSPWIPEDIYQQFLDHLLRREVSVRRVRTNNKWLLTPESRNYNTQLEEIDWGTSDIRALEIIDRYLNNGDLRVWRRDRDSRWVDRDATAAVQAKLTAVKAEFLRWLWEDGERSDALTSLYNNTMNNMHDEESDGSHLTFPGMSEEVRKLLNDHQRNAVWRYLTGGNMMLAHVVGAGKSWTMAAAAMEAKRISGNPSYKTMITVPNHLVTSGQFHKEILEAYPSAKVLAATPDSLSGLGRRALLQKIATGNYDIIVIAHTSFERIPLNPNFEREFIQKQIDDLEEEIRRNRAEAGDDRSYEQELERQKSNLEDKLTSLQERSATDTRSMFFDQLGIDSLFVDEAHEFKNLAFRTSMTRVPGVNPTGSGRAFDMWMKTAYFNQQAGEKNLLFATGTPIANAIAEAYTMMRYLQPSDLQARGIEAFDAWAAQFADEVTKPEIDPAGGGMRMHSRLAEYVNMPELSAILGRVWDVQSAKMLEETLGRPKVKGGKAKKILSERNAILEEIVESLQERAQAVRQGSVDPSTDNMLKIVTDGRKAATDLRLIDPTYPDLKGSKVNLAVENIHRIWKETADEKLTQIVWLDVTSPNQPRGAFNLYRELVDKLVAMGIPKEQIAVMHDFNEKTKGAMFRKMNQGDVRILLGSTGVMGTGVNVQRKLIASHHLDVPWRPDQLEQRDGRILRRGNQNKEAQIYRYVSKGSFDAFMWDKIDQKATFINAMMDGTSGRSIDSSEAEDMSAAEMKAAAADDPNLMEFVRVGAEVQRLESERRGFLDQQSRVRQNLKNAKWAAEYHAEQADAWQAFSDELKGMNISEGDVRASVEGVDFTDPKEFGEALVEALDSVAAKQQKLERSDSVTFTFNGMEGTVAAAIRIPEDPPQFNGKIGGNGVSLDLELSGSASGNVTRLRNQVQKVHDRPEYHRTTAQTNRDKIAGFEERTNQQWPHEKELADLQQEHTRLASLVQTSGDDQTKQEIAKRLTDREGRPVTVSGQTGRYIYDDMEVDETEAVVEPDKVDVVQEELRRERSRQREERMARLREEAEVYEWGDEKPSAMMVRGKKERTRRRRGGRQPFLKYDPRDNTDMPKQLRASPGVGQISAADVIKTWERDFGVPIRVGKVNVNKAAGIYKHLVEVVRLRSEYATNLAVAAHEVAHHIDRENKVIDKLLPKDLWEQMAELDYEPGRKDRKQARREGFSEFVRMYITGIDTGLRAPAVHKWFETVFMPSHPKIAAKITRAVKHAERWSKQGAFARAKGLVPNRAARPVDVTGDDLRDMLETGFHRQMRNWVDQNQAFKVIDQEFLKKGGTFDGRESTYELKLAIDFTAPAHAERAILNGVHTVSQDRRVISTGLAETLKTLKSPQEYDEAQAYAIARFTKELSNTRPEYNSGLDLVDAEWILGQVNMDADKKARYTAFADALTDFNNGLIEMLSDAGVITGQERDKILSSAENYVPLHRILDKRSLKKGAFSGSRMANLPAQLKRRTRKGSELPIVDVVEASMKRALALYNRALKQQVINSIIETVDPRLNGDIAMGKLAEQVPPDRIPSTIKLEETLETLVDEGLLDADTKEDIVVVGMLRGNEAMPSTQRMADVGRRYGLEYDGYDNVEVFVDDLLDATEHLPDAWTAITTWRPSYQPSDAKHIVRFVHNGEPVLYQLDPLVYDTITGMDAGELGPLTQLVRSFNYWFKLGATGFSTGFAGQNVFRDWWDAQAHSTHQGVESVWTPFEWLARYVASEYFHKDPNANEFVSLFKEYGGELQTRLGYESARIKRTKSDLLGFWDILHGPSGFATKAKTEVERFVQASDVGPRLAEFAAVMNQHGYRLKNGKIVDEQGNPAKPPRHVIVKAIVAAGDATVNFKRIGAKHGKILDAWVPFMNAAIQSRYRQVRAYGSLRKGLGDAQAQRIAFATLAMIASGAAYWAYVRDDDDDERADWLRGGYYVYKQDGWPVLRIGKSRDYRFISNMTEAMLDEYVANKHGEVKDRAVEEMWEFMPTGGGIGREAFEQARNWDHFRDGPIEQQHLQRLQPWRRGMDDPNISVVSKAIGQVTGRVGFSPIRVQHLLNSTTGGMYRRLTQTGENLYEGKPTTRDIPLVRGFIMEHDYHQSVSDFYDASGEIGIQRGTERDESGEASPETLKEYEKFNLYESLMTEIRAAERGTNEDEQRTYEWNKYIIGLARDAIGKEPLESFPNPLTEKPDQLPPEIRKIVREYLGEAADRAKGKGAPKSGQDLKRRKATFAAKKEVDRAVRKERRSVFSKGG